MNWILVLFALLALFGICRSSARQYSVHGCKNGQVMLNCRIGTIQIVNVVLGDSSCSGSSCCPREKDCKGPPSASYRVSVNRTCNGMPSCSVRVEIKDIGCSIWAPKNDYANVTYECLVSTTVPVPISTSPLTEVAKLVHISVLDVDFSSKSVQSTASQDITVAPKNSETKSAMEEATPESENQILVLHQKDDNDDRYLDRVTTLAVVIVAGVVITATVISVAVVIAMKKRRVVVKNSDYTMPTIAPFVAEAADETEKYGNFYDVISPNFGDSDCCVLSTPNRAEDASEEDPYLKPVIDEMDQQHYIWVP